MKKDIRHETYDADKRAKVSAIVQTDMPEMPEKVVNGNCIAILALNEETNTCDVSLLGSCSSAGAHVLLDSMDDLKADILAEFPVVGLVKAISDNMGGVDNLANLLRAMEGDEEDE